MKKRKNGFLAKEEIDHDSEIFKYIKELHNYLWMFVLIAYPEASGRLCDYVDDALELLQNPEKEKKK